MFFKILLQDLCNAMHHQVLETVFMHAENEDFEKLYDQLQGFGAFEMSHPDLRFEGLVRRIPPQDIVPTYFAFFLFCFFLLSGCTA